ncbi:RNA chaperone Hfq [Paraburkholderia sp. J41]|uniref:RNA chaperone Hfq n=1 Tax=Paraburkholderia sp. J41 TaxID=2805433 RepID=UPI002AC336C7|nr:RNA chaperone Hfq [Paraburkholderia sp. J41]
MPSAESHPQNDFMNAARKERKRVEIYLVNGIRLTGCIESFDQYLVMLRTPVGLQGIYKRAISTIQLDTGTRPGPRPGGGSRGSHGEHTSRGPHGAHGTHGGHGPRESREPREPRDAWSSPSGERPERGERPSSPSSSSDGPVVVTRRRRLYGAVNNGGNGNGNDGSGNH